MSDRKALLQTIMPELPVSDVPGAMRNQITFGQPFE
jgi:hypothetical protein